jgi:ankyrin repeat protein
MSVKNTSSLMREIYDAIYASDLALLRRLLDSQTYVNQLSWQVWSDWAEGWKDYAIEELTPLAKAAELGNIEIVKLLLQVGHNLVDWRFPLNEALCVACESGNVQLIRILLESKADIGHTRGTAYMNDSSFLNYAIFGNHIEAIQTLVAFGFDVNGAGDEEGSTPLMVAALTNNVPIAQYLVKVGADVNQTDTSQWCTALTQAAYSGHQEMFDYLEPFSSLETIKIAREKLGQYAQNPKL